MNRYVNIVMYTPLETRHTSDTVLITDQHIRYITCVDHQEVLNSCLDLLRVSSHD